MGFENHSRPGIVEVASKIALKHGVIYNIKLGTFKGLEAQVTKTVAALDRWAQAERMRVRG